MPFNGPGRTNPFAFAAFFAKVFSNRVLAKSLADSRRAAALFYMGLILVPEIPYG